MPLGGQGRDQAVDLLARNKNELRRMIGKVTNLKYTPDLRFRLDETFDQLDETRRLFDQDDVRRDLDADDQDQDD
jgi:ribosome-binding factor A